MNEKSYRCGMCRGIMTHSWNACFRKLHWIYLNSRSKNCNLNLLKPATSETCLILFWLLLLWFVETLVWLCAWFWVWLGIWLWIRLGVWLWIRLGIWLGVWLGAWLEIWFEVWLMNWLWILLWVLSLVLATPRTPPFPEKLLMPSKLAKLPNAEFPKSKKPPFPPKLLGSLVKSFITETNIDIHNVFIDSLKLSIMNLWELIFTYQQVEPILVDLSRYKFKQMQFHFRY